MSQRKMDIIEKDANRWFREYRASQPDPRAYDHRIRDRFPHTCANPKCRKDFMGRRHQKFCSVACNIEINRKRHR